MAPRAAVVTVGDELLLGRTVDTNAAWLSARMADLGVPVVRTYTVGDVVEEIRLAVGAAIAAADVVLVSGGLGPTPDDLTRDSVAGLLGLPLEVDQGLLAALRERFRARGYGELPETNRAQAQVPAGATVLENRLGTAPGLAMEASDALVVLLPGVPRELKGIFTGVLQQILNERFVDRVGSVHTRTIHTTGIPESLLAQRIEELSPALSDVTLAFLPDLRGVDLRLTAAGLSASESEAAFDRAEAELRSAVEVFRFDSPDGDIAASVLEAVRAARTALATAESCTGGLVGKRLTDIPGSSAVYRGGVGAYANEAKRDLLGVDEGMIEMHGAVSEPVARLMAEGAARVLGAEAAMAVTGVAGPGGGTEEKPVGLVWIAATLRGRTVAERLTLPGNRDAVRERAAQAGLFLLLRLLEGRL